MMTQILLSLISIVGLQVSPAHAPQGKQSSPGEQARLKAQTDELRAILAKATKLPLKQTEILPNPQVRFFFEGLKTRDRDRLFNLRSASVASE